VRVRSCIDGRVLRHVTEREARLMCSEDSFADRLHGVEAIGYRLSRKKEKLTDIRLLAPLKAERPSDCSLSQIDMQNNAFAQSFSALGNTDSISALERAVAKVEALPDVHEDRAVSISAGKA